MDANTDEVFDSMAIVFVALTVLVGLVIISVALGVIDTPFLAPREDLLTVTPLNLPTLTPSSVPADLTPIGTPTIKPSENP